MARPVKNGLDYFPLDVDIFENDKLFDVQNEYGPLGEVIYIRLLCLVYKNGYYYRFESLDKLSAMIIKSIGSRWARDKKTVTEVILYLAKSNLFSTELMQRNVITSRSIQRRYLAATERRQSKIKEYNLLEEENQEGLETAPKSLVSAAETRVNAAETPVYVSNNATKESKVKKKKEKERKEEERKAAEPPAASPQSVCCRLPAVNGEYILTTEFYNSLAEAYPHTDIDECIKSIKIWLTVNPAKRKPSNSMDRFVSNWIKGDAERGKHIRHESDATYDLEAYENSTIFDNEV